MSIIQKNINIFDAKADLLVHQVNNIGVMGSGLAKQIREHYPQVFKEYSDFCIKTHPDCLLGVAQIVNISDDFSVCNLFGQEGFGKNKRYTRYDALTIGFEQINEKFAGKTVAIPYGLGCGLGGGNWEIVFTIIKETLTDCNIVICKYP